MSALKIRKLNDNKKKIVTWKDHEENTSLTIRENTENIIERKTDYLNTLVGALQKGHIHLPLFSEQTHKLHFQTLMKTLAKQKTIIKKLGSQFVKLTRQTRIKK